MTINRLLMSIYDMVMKAMASKNKTMEDLKTMENFTSLDGSQSVLIYFLIVENLRAYTPLVLVLSPSSTTQSFISLVLPDLYMPCLK